MGPVQSLQDPQTSLFSNFFIKNGSYSTIHTSKNYFATIFSVFSKINYNQMNRSETMGVEEDERLVLGAKSKYKSSVSLFLLYYIHYN